MDWCQFMDNQGCSSNFPTIIAARPGVLREALRAMLASFPCLEISGVAGGGLLALSLVRQHKPALLIIDSGLLEDEIAMLLQKVKQEQPQIRCLVLVDTTRQQEAVLAMGADATLLHSEPAGRLLVVLDQIGLR